MTEYGQAFYGSDEIHAILGGQSGKFFFTVCREWNSEHPLSFAHKDTLYKLRADHWFYGSDEFRRAKKPSDEIANPLADYSDDELQNKIKSMQAEIDRRKLQVDEITTLARKVCAYNNSAHELQTDFIAGNRDDTRIMRVAKAAIINGMELQRGNTRPLCPETLEAAAKVADEHSEDCWTMGSESLSVSQGRNKASKHIAQKIRNLKGEL